MRRIVFDASFVIEKSRTVLRVVKNLNEKIGLAGVNCNQPQLVANKLITVLSLHYEIVRSPVSPNISKSFFSRINN